MQYLIYPTKTMCISQSYDGKTSHNDELTGKPMAYAIDENCGDKKRDYFYAPCDLYVKRVYGIDGPGTNTIWMQSKDKVKLANGTTSYVTIRVTHPNDDTLKKFKVGQFYKQYDKLFLEGNDGFATGYHFHIEVNTCKFEELDGKIQPGWVKNSRGAWVTSPHSIKPEDAFFIDKKFTKVIKTLGLNFKYLPTEKVTYYPKYEGKSKSIVDALTSLKIDATFKNRSNIAKINNIKLYIGSAYQNKKMLSLLMEGKLIKKIG